MRHDLFRFASATLLVLGGAAAGAATHTGRTEALVAQGTQQSGPSYTSVRAAALAEGWQPAATSDSDCAGEGVIGYVGPNDEARNFCEVLPEIENCTSNGLCLMRFRQPASGRILEITTYGDYSAWGGPDQDAALYVQGGRIDGNDIEPAHRH
jgi:hypothetical protein